MPTGEERTLPPRYALVVLTLGPREGTLLLVLLLVLVLVLVLLILLQ